MIRECPELTIGEAQDADVAVFLIHGEARIWRGPIIWLGTPVDLDMETLVRIDSVFPGIDIRTVTK